SDLDNVTFDRQFDLIWCGSLLTHLCQDDILKLFNLFSRSISEKGMAVFTAHGDFVAKRLAAEYEFYGLREPEAERLAKIYAANGFAYGSYELEETYGEVDLMDSNYGVSLTSPVWINKKLSKVDGIRQVFFRPQGWDDHQDVYAVVRQLSGSTGDPAP
ncbi:MAG: hypothetical protein ABIO36_05545, partial [Pyrinomonadaceae bacterium]